MRISIPIIALSSVLLLSSCAPTTPGYPTPLEKKVNEKVSDVSQSIKEYYNNAPRGYYGSNKKLVLKPQGMEQAPDDLGPVQTNVLEPMQTETGVRSSASLATSSVARAKTQPDSGLVWNRVDSYDATQPVLPAANASAVAAPERMMSIPVNSDVMVFPVDGDAEPYGDLASADMQVYDRAGMPEQMQEISPSAKMAEQLFFEYGSDRVAPQDRKDLRKLAARLKRVPEYRVDVVGHASKRVDHVTDPIQKKMINFEMAQKRADAVSRELKAAGAKPAWVMAISRGDETPNPNPGNRTQEAADRRVDVYVDRQ